MRKINLEQKDGIKFSIALKLIFVVALVELVIMLVFTRFEFIKRFPVLGAALDTVILSIFIVIIFYYLLDRPLKLVMRSISDIQKGNLDIEVKVDSSDEIGVLAKAFNQMIQDLKEQRTQLVDKAYVESIIAYIVESLIVVDSSGLIKTVNRATQELLGYREDELIGQPLEKFLEEQGALETLNRMDSVKDLEMYYKTKHGEKIPVSLSGSAMKDKDGAIVIIARDMREIKRLELQLIRSKKLAAIGELAAGVAHEINNPLNVISGNAEILSKENQNRDVKLATKIIIEQVKRAAAITDMLLQFSKRREPKTEPVDINKVIRDTLLLLEYQVRLENITMVKYLNTGLLEVMGDSGQLQQVFLNIMVNAVQAMHGGGKLNIRSYVEKVTEFGKRKTDIFKLGGKVVVIEFEDTGEGIPEEKLEKIFDPFFSTKEQGIGLGLSICHGIIEAHQGSIEVQSKLGKGATFIIKLPALKKEMQNG